MAENSDAHEATRRSRAARIGAHSKWAQTTDRSAATASARKAALDRFERQVDPSGTLDPAERAKRAEHARTAYFTQLAQKSAEARRRTKTAEAAPKTGRTPDSARKATRRFVQSLTIALRNERDDELRLHIEALRDTLANVTVVKDCDEADGATCT